MRLALIIFSISFLIFLTACSGDGASDGNSANSVDAGPPDSEIEKLHNAILTKWSYHCNEISEPELDIERSESRKDALRGTEYYPVKTVTSFNCDGTPREITNKLKYYPDGFGDWDRYAG